jgi:hypothetical protein
MKKLLLGILIGATLEVLFFVLAALADGACHCVKPTIVLFPYAGITLLRSWESVSLPLLMLQFPVYSVITARVSGWRWKLVSLLIILVLHVMSAAVGLTLYR